MFTKFMLTATAFQIGLSGMPAQTNKVMQTNHNQQAPGQVIKHGKLIYSEILIHATPEKVWSILTNFSAYPDWNPFIKTIEGAPEVGGNIKAFIQPPGQKGMHFAPRVLQFTPNREFRWIGKVGISRIFDGEHTFVLEDQGNGTVLFKQYERFRGVLVPFFKKMLEVDTIKGFEAMNEKLKAMAENR